MKLQRKQENLSIRSTVSKLSNFELETRISGKEFNLDNNNYNIESLYFAFSDDGCTFAIRRDGRITSVKAGHGKWTVSNTASASLLVPPRNMSAKSIDANYTVNQPPVKAGASYAWTDKSTLEITARFVEESLGEQTVVCRFTETERETRISIDPNVVASRAGGPRGGFAPASQQLRGVMVEIR